MYEPARRSDSPETLFAQARFRECLGAARGSAFLGLQARCHLRLGEPARAAHYAAMIEDAGERFTLLGTALSRLGCNDDAEAHFDEAKRIARSSELRAELQYFCGLHYWGKRDLSAAQECLSDPVFTRPGSSRIRAITLRAWICWAQGRHEEHIAGLVRALDEVQALPGGDVFVMAAVAHGLSVQARERYLPAIAKRLSPILDSLPISSTGFLTRRNVGWAHALSGDFVGAFRELRAAASVAPAPAWKACAIADRALLSRGLQYTAAANDELDHAESLVHGIDWSAQHGEERFVLLTLAELSAQSNPSLARSYLDRYHSIETPVSALLAFRSDERVTALEQYAGGCVLRYEGKRSEAIAAYRTAYEIWTRCGYDWRRATVLVDLGEMQLKREFFETAAELLKKFPQSWIAGRLGDRIKPAMDPLFGTLTPREREIAILACEGMTYEDIGVRIGLSPNTVRNRLHDCYSKFDVHNRTQFVAECRRRGISC